MWLHSGRALGYLKATGRLSRSQWLWQTCSLSDIPYKKAKLAPLQERKMVDRFKLMAKGGDGGNGCASFRRSRHDHRGTPDGGNGGRGGDVILECSPSAWDFSSLQHHVNAKRGKHGAPKNMIGSRGDDKVVLVPIGTVIHLIKGELPGSVEKQSSEVLYPWETPGSLVNNSEGSSSTNGTSLKPIDASFAGTNDGIHEAPSSNISEIVTEQSLGEKTSFVAEKSQVRDNGVSELVRATKPKLTEDVQYNVAELTEAGQHDDMSELDSDNESKLTEDIQYNVAELTELGQQIIVARGGDGGLGNLCLPRPLAQPSKNREKDADSINEDEQACSKTGVPGSEAVLLLELKSIADVGFVGMPNAGKSTLLSAISRARPAIGDYAFTTLRPNLGKLHYDDISITVADIPGLIRGAHQNRGLGHAFLRHIERTKVLAYVLDLSAGLDGRKGLPPWEQLKDLVLELEFYRKGLSNRPSLIVANKIDEEGAEHVFEELKERVDGVPIFPVCAVLEEGVTEVKDGLRMLVSGKEVHRLSLDNIVFD